MAPYFDRRSFFFWGMGENHPTSTRAKNHLSGSNISIFLIYFYFFRNLKKWEKWVFAPNFDRGTFFFLEGGRGSSNEYLCQKSSIWINYLDFLLFRVFFKLGKKSKIYFLAEGQKNYIRVGRVTKGTYYKNMTQITAYLPIQMN